MLFNIGDYVGRMLASIIKQPQATHGGSLIILGISLLRLAFIPLFLFCNAIPDKRVITDVSTKFLYLFNFTENYSIDFYPLISRITIDVKLNFSSGLYPI